MDSLIYEAEPELTEEQYYACAVKGCESFVLDDEPNAKFWDCAKHGATQTRKVRQFRNGKMVSEFHAPIETIKQHKDRSADMSETITHAPTQEGQKHNYKEVYMSPYQGVACGQRGINIVVGKNPDCLKCLAIIKSTPHNKGKE